MNALAPYWKAVVGFLAPGFAIIVSAVLASSDGGTTITTSEWITAVATAFITAAGVYAVRNAPVRSSRKPARDTGRI